MSERKPFGANPDEWSVSALRARVADLEVAIETSHANEEREYYAALTLRARVKVLEAALAFYADPKTYSDNDPKHYGEKFSRPITYDVDETSQGGAIWFAGARARKALGVMEGLAENYPGREKRTDYPLPLPVSLRCPECGEMMHNHVLVTRHATGSCEESFSTPPGGHSTAPCSDSPKAGRSKWPCFWCGLFEAHGTGFPQPGSISTVPACKEHAAAHPFDGIRSETPEADR